MELCDLGVAFVFGPRRGTLPFPGVHLDRVGSSLLWRSRQSDKNLLEAGARSPTPTKARCFLHKCKLSIRRCGVS